MWRVHPVPYHPYTTPGYTIPYAPRGWIPQTRSGWYTAGAVRARTRFLSRGRNNSRSARSASPEMKPTAADVLNAVNYFVSCARNAESSFRHQARNVIAVPALMLPGKCMKVWKNAGIVSGEAVKNWIRLRKKYKGFCVPSRIMCRPASFWMNWEKPKQSNCWIRWNLRPSRVCGHQEKRWKSSGSRLAIKEMNLTACRMPTVLRSITCCVANAMGFPLVRMMGKRLAAARPPLVRTSWQNLAWNMAMPFLP